MTLTVKAIEAFRPGPAPYKLTLDRGLQMRIAPDGTRTLLVRYTVEGTTTERQYRLPQTYGDGPSQLKLAAARAEAHRIRALARQGIDWPAQEESRLREAHQASTQHEAEEALTFKSALQEYVEKKRRARDGLALKARTRADYLGMVAPGRVCDKGRRFADGELLPIANTPITQIQATDIRAIYERQLERSERQAVYAMQVLRAVLRWHGVVVANNPLGRETPGRHRIVLASPKGAPAPIPPERLGAWWNAAVSNGRVAADYYRFQLLTGCRGGEIHGNKRYGYAPMTVGDVDLLGGRIVLRDTKNRADHKLLLSRQALEIAHAYCKDREPDAPLFPIVDARKTLARINAVAGTQVQGHGVRVTFASIAEELVSGGILKRMMNHAAGGDVTLGHYVGKGEAALRAGWQTVADYVEACATRELGSRPTAISSISGKATG